MRLITAHRILIVAGIAFFLLYALIEARAWVRTGSRAALAQAIVSPLARRVDLRFGWMIGTSVNFHVTKQAPAQPVPSAASAGESREVRVTVVNGSPGASESTVSLELPQSWTSTPAEQPLKLARSDESQTLRFLVKPPLGTKAGVDPQELYEAIKVGGFGRGKLLDVIPKVVFPGNFEMTGAWGMPLSYGRKDMGLATELGRQFNVPMSIASLVEQDMIAGVARGWANKEQTIFLTLQEERAAISLRVPKH